MRLAGHVTISLLPPPLGQHTPWRNPVSAWRVCTHQPRHPSRIEGYCTCNRCCPFTGFPSNRGDYRANYYMNFLHDYYDNNSLDFCMTRADII
jgi:hypothetical protein